jgi:ribosomal protein S18 acetylase RimI-like enzyme
MTFKITREGIEAARAEVRHLGGGDWELTWIVTSPQFRSQGMANRLLAKAMALVTRKGNLLVAFLDPKPGGLTHDQERDWLKRKGFNSGWYDFGVNGTNNKRAMFWRPK